MKQVLSILALSGLLIACESSQKQETKSTEPASSITLPYTPTYSVDVDQNVSDDDLLVVLNSYKDWETGNMGNLRNAFGDSISFNGWDGTNFNGLTDSLLTKWSASRDSLSEVKIEIHVWMKNHFLKDDHRNITLWYTETDTYKDGNVVKFEMHDINQVKDGKIIWYSQYRRAIESE